MLTACVRARRLLTVTILSGAPTAHAHATHLETSTGLDNRKLAIWTFIGSECLFFATLISNYLVNKDKSLRAGPFPTSLGPRRRRSTSSRSSRSRSSRWARRCSSSARSSSCSRSAARSAATGRR